MHKIVMLDTYLYQEKDFAFLGNYGDYRLFDQTTPEEVRERIQDATILLVNKTHLGQADLRSAPQVQYIGVTATGYNMVDIHAAHTYAITVTNIPAYGTASVAQHTLALLLALTNHVHVYNDVVQSKAWARSQRFCVLGPPLIELAGKTLGLIGYGAIAQHVAKIARAFGMTIQAYSRTVRVSHEVAFVPFSRVLETSDMISLHCPLTPETYHIINADALATMQPSALLINTSRGALIDETALYEALQHHTIAGAALDVLAAEPPPCHHPLYTCCNCLITPHIAWSTREARARILRMTEENLAAFLAGTPQNVVHI